MRGSRGFSLVEVVVASAVVLIASTVMLDSYLYSLKGSKVIQYHFRAWEYKENVENLLKDKTAWAKMLTQNTFKNCLESDAVTSCPPSPAPTTQPPAQSGFLFPVQRADGSSFLDSTNPRAGIGLNGKVCTGFNPQADNRDCPLRAEVRWSPICSGPCTSGKSISQLRVDFSLLGNKSVPNINLAQYQFSLYKSIVATAPPVIPPPPVIERPGPWYIPQIAASEDGKRYILVGTDGSDSNNKGLTHISGMVLDENGTVIRDVFAIETVPYCSGGSCSDGYHVAVTNVGNNFVVIWDNGSFTVSPGGTKMAIFNGDGQLIRGPELIKNGTGFSPVFIKSFDAGKHFAVVERSWAEPSWMRVFKADGTLVGSEIDLTLLLGKGNICGFAHAYQSDQIQFYAYSGMLDGHLHYFKKTGANWGFEKTYNFPTTLYSDCWHDVHNVARSADGDFLFINQTSRSLSASSNPKEIRAYRLPAGSSADPIPEGVATFYYNSSRPCNSAGTAGNWPGITQMVKPGFLNSVIHYSRYSSVCYPTDSPKPGRVVVSVGPDGSIAKTFASATSPPLMPYTSMDYKFGGTKAIFSVGNDNKNDKIIIRLHPYEQ